MPLLERKSDNLFSYPDTIAQHDKDSTVTVSDIDGDSLMLLNWLIREGIISLDGESYEQFACIYSEDKLTPHLDSELDKIIDKFTGERLDLILQFIGDELADRGKNDYITLKIIKKLSQLGIRYSIIASNHGMEFFQQYMHGIEKNYVGFYQGRNSCFGASLHGLRTTITDGVVKKEEIEDLVEKFYLPHLQLLSYEADENSKNIIFYTHACTHQLPLKELAEEFWVEYKDETFKEFVATLDRLNSQFKRIIQDKTHKKELGDEKLFPAFHQFINLRYAQLEAIVEKEKSVTYDYTVTNVHGHTGAEELSSAQLGHWTHCNTDWCQLTEQDFDYRIFSSKPPVNDLILENSNSDKENEKNHHENIWEDFFLDEVGEKENEDATKPSQNFSGQKRPLCAFFESNQATKKEPSVGSTKKIKLY